MEERALGFGPAKDYIDSETSKAISCHMAAVDTVIRPKLQPSCELQKMLTLPLHPNAIHWLMQNADEPTHRRLYSLTTQHRMPQLGWLRLTR